MVSWKAYNERISSLWNFAAAASDGMYFRMQYLEITRIIDQFSPI